MKLSKYNVEVSIDDKRVIYNTLSRKYIAYSNSNKGYMDILLNNLNKEKYSQEEAEILKKLISKELIIEDNFDELNRIRFYDNRAKFHDEIFYLVIQPTLDCNFRCVYCYEEHRKLNIDQKLEEGLIKFVEYMSKRVRRLKVAWFGGEPMMEFDSILRLTKEFKRACLNNNCIYEARMTTNGYLFSEENYDLVKELSINEIQITLDGIDEDHDKKRPLSTGEGTYERIKNNIIKLLERDIDILLRINVDEQNYTHIDRLFDIIPEDKRGKVKINISNLFGNDEKFNLYNLYRTSIDKGFKYHNTANNYMKCEAFSKNACTVQPDGRITPCSFAAEKGLYFGKINELGALYITNKSEYFEFQNVTALSNDKCKECVQLPMCMGGCTFARYKNKDTCNGWKVDGLRLEEKIRLHYYNDVKYNFMESEIVV